MDVEREDTLIGIVWRRRTRKKRRKKRRRSGCRKSLNFIFELCMLPWTKRNRKKSKRILLKGIWIDASISFSIYSFCNGSKSLE